MELNELIRSALSDAKWLIAKGGTDRAEVLNCVLGNIDDALKEDKDKKIRSNHGFRIS